jgi:hypothetical protein
MNTVELASLHPTQATHGVRQVRDKARRYRDLSKHDLHMAIAEKPIAVVLGAHGRHYVIDHHHVAGALLRIGVERAPFVLAADLSSLSETEFWLTLENRAWTWPYDADGRRVPFRNMPRRLQDAQDDDFRSLAAAVRDAGGYVKTAVPLAEFRWAAFFHGHFARPRDDAEYAALLDWAVALAHSDAAIGLPGYLGAS